MVTISGPVRAEAWVRELYRDGFRLRVELPAFRYAQSSTGMDRLALPAEPLTIALSSVAASYDLAYPPVALVGEDPSLFRSWFAAQGSRPLSALRLLLPWSLAKADGTLLARGHHQPLLLPIVSAAPFVNNEPVRLTHWPLTDTARLPAEYSPADVFVLVNEDEYMRLLDEISDPGAPQDERYLARILMALQWLTGDGPTVQPGMSDGQLEQLTSKLNQANIPTTVGGLRRVLEALPELVSFPIDIANVDIVRPAGTFHIQANEGEAIPRGYLDFYRLSAECRVRTADNSARPFRFTAAWTGDVPDPMSGPVAFVMSADRPLVTSSADGEVLVRVTGFDGATLWSRRYSPGAEELQALEIVVAAHLPQTLEQAPSRLDGERRLRGQVLSKCPQQRVAGLTVLVQACTVASTVWRVVSAGKTNQSGHFSLNYPKGVFVAAQALLSVSPDSVVDVDIIQSEAPDETLSDSFLYLLLESDSLSEKSCSRGPQRLPDQAELLGSDEYTQDLGGRCVNVSTPNRTLQEHRYTAIVRTSDPDVANYTLVHHREEGTFDLVGGADKIERSPVDLHNPIRWQDGPDLDNPIRWQDAPRAAENLSLYQAVTVATGHVLTFRSVLKADGYSLGELVYSLPLAPGQKKQIVVYDVANSLEGGEVQTLTQGERLAASLVDDRLITNELAGGIDESTRGRSSASTGGVSAGLGLGGSVGAISGTLGVAGGYASSKASASQSGSRNVTQFFGEKLRQALMQNAESYRRLNASVVTTVKEGQEYAVTTEVVANHNHCHSLTMMYFEVLRHYAVSQELADVQECVFVPLLLTHFTPANISKWKDILAANLLPMPANTYLPARPLARSSRWHPLAHAFDANERVETDWAHVNYPEGTYADDPIRDISGEFTLRVRLPRPPTRFDRILSLPVITKTVTRTEADPVATARDSFILGALNGVIPGISFMGGISEKTIEEQVQVRQEIFDYFMVLDANFETVPPAQAIRVTRFRPDVVEGIPVDFFDNPVDREQWDAYAHILSPDFLDAYDLLEAYFKDKLIAEFDDIFRRDIAPLLFRRIVDTVRVDPLNLDLTLMGDYTAGERAVKVRLASSGAPSITRRELTGIWIRSTSTPVHQVRSFTTLVVENVRIRYATAHYEGHLFNGYVGDDLLDADPRSGGVRRSTPLNSEELRNPRDEDRYAVRQLLNELNSKIVQYNIALWRNLDADQRYMLLDGFNIQTFDRTGGPLEFRSLASVIKNELVAVVGNSLVFPVADGYRVSQSLIVSDDAESGSLLDHYRPDHEVEPYRLSVPTRGVFMEAVMGQCDACEEVKENSSQDWDRFRTDEPTAIAPVVPPTPQRTDWRAVWRDFAQPLVAIQTPRETPAPGSGLAQLSDLLANSETFRDITGLAGTQDNVIRTYLSNQENARAFAEMAKTLAMQEHNSANSRSITRALEEARDRGAISDNEYGRLVRDHLEQQIDGGTRQAAERRAAESRQPSLTNAAIDAVEQGREVTAQRTGQDGTTETVRVGRVDEESAPGPVLYDVPLIPQPNKTSCWAAAMAMLESYRRSLNSAASVHVSPAELADEVGYSLEQSYGWDRLEDVKEHYGFQDIEVDGSNFPSAEQWRTWLTERGPLYITMQGTPSHAIIVRGIRGTASGAEVDILNPWDTSETFDDDPTTFHPPNRGLASTLSVDELNAQFTAGALGRLQLYRNWRILYHPELAQTETAPSGQVAEPTDPPAGVIERLWVWGGGGVPQSAIGDPSHQWWTAREALGMTDFVVCLNDHSFSGGLGILPVYRGSPEAGTWRPICQILDTLNSKGIAPHLMVYFPPDPDLIREAASALNSIVSMCAVVPRSIQLDLEGWWTSRRLTQRQAGEAAIRRYFFDEWTAPRPELGIGVTCVGSVPPAIRGALGQVNFTIPQMYASASNYGRPLQEDWVQRHHARAAEAVGEGGQVIIGQTANTTHNDPNVLRNMLRIILGLDHGFTGQVSEVAFWSDILLLRNAGMRNFFTRLSGIVRAGGLDATTIEDL